MKIVSGLFDRRDTATKVVSDLEAAGIPASDISIVYPEREHDDRAADGAGIGAGLGAAVGGAGGLLAGLGMLAIPGVGPVVAAGWLAATAAGAVGGALVGGAAGGIVGAMTSSGVSEEDAHLYAEGVRRGSTLVSARVSDAHYATAERIVNGNGRVDLAERRRLYLEDGWTRFDEGAKPYTEAEIERERSRFL